MIATQPAQSLTGRAPNDFARRALVLSAVFALATLALFAVSAPPHADAEPRYPTDGVALSVDGWAMSDAGIEGRPGVAFVTRDYRRSSDGARASLAITTSAQAKLVYRASADVPLLGNGYTVETLPGPAERTLQIARRGTEAWLQIATFGERRGAFGNGVSAWGLAVFDTVLGHSNDYYLARIIVPYVDSASTQTATQLAHTLFPRLAAYYAT